MMARCAGTAHAPGRAGCADLVKPARPKAGGSTMSFSWAHPAFHADALPRVLCRNIFVARRV